MVLLGSVPAPSICLRCQLRRALRQAGGRQTLPIPSRARLPTSRLITTTSRYHQDAEEGELIGDNNEKESRSYRYKHPLGRVIGKPGKRQRQSSAQLRIDALEKPFDVIVMRDVDEGKVDKTLAQYGRPARSDSTSGISSAQIESELSGEGVATQDEVDESIDSLQPDTRMVDDEYYQVLLKQLKDGYTVEQLSQYLTKSLNLESVTGDAVQLIPEESMQRKGRLKRSPWISGRSPIENRRSVGTVVKKSEMRANQTKLAQQILRLAWKLAIESEEQSVGELEMSLKSWQLAYLFDLTANGAPMYQRMIKSPLLKDYSEVRPYRPHNVMRITARRQVAEEVADQLENQLHEVGSLSMDLTVFKSMLGQPGWPDRLDHIFDDRGLKYVEECTSVVVERKSSKELVIHGNSERSRELAQRVLLSLLKLPSPGSSSTATLDANYESGDSHRPILLPENVSSDLHGRYRDTTLGRLTMPTAKLSQATHRGDAEIVSRETKSQSESMQVAFTQEFARSVVDQLSKVESPPVYPFKTNATDVKEQSSASDHTKSYWTVPSNQRALRWEVHFCKLLQEIESRSGLELLQSPSRSQKRKSKTRDHTNKTGQLLIVQPQVPAIHSLLPYFVPSSGGRRESSTEKVMSPAVFVAHLMPSPFSGRSVAAMQDLPRITIRYNLGKLQAHEGFTDEECINVMSATLFKQELFVPLPGEIVDLRILRRLPMIADTDRVREDGDIRRFTKAVRESVLRRSDALLGDPHVKIKLPSWLVHKQNGDKDKISKEDVEVDYLLDRFEESQTADLAPTADFEALNSMDPEIRKTLESMPKYSDLRYRDIDGGAVDGKTTELSLRYNMSYALMIHKLLDANLLQSDKKDKNGYPSTFMRQWSAEEEQERIREFDTQLVEAALSLASAFTRLNAKADANSYVVRKMYRAPFGSEDGDVVEDESM